MSRPPILEISSAEMCKSLLSPVRLEVSEFLRSNGEATVSELAAMLCRPPELLYRHLDILVKAGVVVQTGYRKKGRHVERVYDLTADDIFLAFKGKGSPEDNDAVVEMMGCFSRIIDRTIRRATSARLVDYEAQPRQLMLRYEMSWLTTEDLEELHVLIARIKAIMDAGRKKRHGSVYRWLAVLCPFSEKSGSEKSSAGKTSARKSTAKKGKPTKTAPEQPPTSRSVKRPARAKTIDARKGLAIPSANGASAIAKNRKKTRRKTKDS